MYYYPTDSVELQWVKDIKAYLPDAEWPDGYVSDDFLATIGVFPIEESSPEFDASTEKLQSDGIADVGGVWARQWLVVPLTSDELNARRESMEVPRLAARLALIEDGSWDLIPPIIDAIPDAVSKAQTLAFFEDARNWKRLDTTVITLGAALGKDDAGLDDLFTRAIEIDESLL